MIEYKKLAVICSILLAFVAFGSTFVKVIKWSRGVDKDIKAIKNMAESNKNENSLIKAKIEQRVQCENDLKIKDARIEERLKNLEKHH